VAGYIVGAPGLGQGRREHVLRHHLHHALSYSVAEEQRCARLLQHCVWFFLSLGMPVSYEIQSGARAYLLIDSLLGRRRPWFYLLTPRGRGG
jgi:hypothetical protein